jgi:hypothetical protein
MGLQQRKVLCYVKFTYEYSNFLIINHYVLWNVSCQLQLKLTERVAYLDTILRELR